MDHLELRVSHGRLGDGIEVVAVHERDQVAHQAVDLAGRWRDERSVERARAADPALNLTEPAEVFGQEVARAGDDRAMPVVQRGRRQWRPVTLLDGRGDGREVVGNPFGRLSRQGRIELGGGDIGERRAHPFEEGGGDTLGAQQQSRQGLPARRQLVASPPGRGRRLLGPAGGGLRHAEVAVGQRVGNPGVHAPAVPSDRHRPAAHAPPSVSSVITEG